MLDLKLPITTADGREVKIIAENVNLNDRPGPCHVALVQTADDPTKYYLRSYRPNGTPAMRPIAARANEHLINVRPEFKVGDEYLARNGGRWCVVHVDDRPGQLYPVSVLFLHACGACGCYVEARTRDGSTELHRESPTDLITKITT